jgi:hypothetical protein
MTIKYTELETTILMETEDGVISYIPKDPSNSDYQAYLEHEAATI